MCECKQSQVLFDAEKDLLVSPIISLSEFFSHHQQTISTILARKWKIYETNFQSREKLFARRFIFSFSLHMWVF